MSAFRAPRELRTGRVVLRCYRPGDGAMFAEARNASYEHLVRFIPWVRPAISDQHAERIVGGFCDRFSSGEDYNLAIVTRDDRRLLGSTDLRPDSESGGRCAEIGLWIRADAAFAGLGTHVLSSLLHWGFTAWPFERLLWKCDVDNAASVRVARKCWMQWVGVVENDHLDRLGRARDSHCFQALRSEWTTGLRQHRRPVACHRLVCAAP